MYKAARWALLLSFVAIFFAVTWDFTPGTSSRNKAEGEAKTSGPATESRRDRRGALQAKTLNGLLAGTGNMGPIPEPTIAPDEPPAGDGEDPDLPPGLAGRIDKEEYLRARNDYIDMLRGRDGEVPDGARESAIVQMEKQEAQMSRTRSSQSTLVNTTDWNFIGPAPIPMGQTSNTRVPVSGRTISIAVHPTDPDTVYVGTAQGGLYKSTNGGANWTKLFEFQLESLAIGAITIDPTDSSIVYVGTGENGQSADSALGRGLYIIRNANSVSPTLSGPFRLDGAGNNVFSGRAIGRVLVNPANNNVIFVCTSSATGGNPNTTTVLQPPRGVYRSVNAQSATPTFEQIQITGISTPNDRNTIDIEMDPANPNLVLATVIGVSGDGGIYRTANALAATPTFTRPLTLPNGATNGRAELTVTRSAAPATTFYAATGETSSAALGGPACPASRSGLLRRSTDGGLTWSTPLPGSTGFCGGQCFYDIAVAVTPDNQTIHLGGAARNSAVALCVIDVMKRSTNGGASFARNDDTLHADEHALAIAPSNPQVVYTGSDGGIWRSTDNGTNWTSLNNMDFSATQFQGVAVHPFDRNFLMGGTQDNGTICFAANGTVSHCRDGDGGYAIIDDNAQDTTNVTMYHTFFNQTNSQIGFERASSTLANPDGQLSNWTFRGCATASNNGINCTNAVLFYAPMEQGPGNPNTLYFGTDRLYRSTNRGDTMTVVSQGPFAAGVVVTTIGVSPQDDNVRIVGLRNGKVFATTTGAAALTDVTGANFPPPNPLDLTRNSIGKAVIDPNNRFTAYVSFTSFSPPAGQQIFKTTNLNDPVPIWTASSSGIPQVPVSSLAVDPQDSNSIFAGTEIGVYHSSDGGANWLPYGLGLPRVAVFDVKISNVQRYLRIATHGRGIWEIGIPGRQLPVLRNGGATIFAEGCAPGNGVIDPGEDVTMNFGVSNIGPGPTNNLVVTLLATGGVAFPSGPQTYGVVNSSATGTGQFRFSNNGTCGGTITLTFHLQDGALDLGNVSIPFTLGLLVDSAPTFTENFDGVVAPALPSGWTTTQTGAAAAWVTDTTNDTPPNSAFGAGAATPSDNSLTSPVIAIPAAPVVGTNPGVRLRFRNSYNTEAGFDGGVLEISINGGPFTDIVTAGGSFVEGGYTGILGPTDSVLSGRQGWTGNSGGFITTTIVLPAASYSQNARFRWRTAYDTGTNPTGGGMRIDTISVYASTRVCCGGACVLTCPANITVSNYLGQCGAVVTYDMPTETGNCGGVVTSNHPSGEFFPVGTTTVTLTDTRLNGTTSTCMFTVTVNDTQKPTVTAPANITVSNDPGRCSATVNPGTATASDNCPGATVSGVRSDALALSAPYPVGTTTITWTATDAAGNTSMPPATQTVRVNDTQPPAVSNPSATPAMLWPPNHRMVDVTVNYTASDNCPGSGCVLSVASNEPPNGTGDGDTSPDWQIVDATHVRLRAERAGTGSGRIYTITVTCTDAAGNVTTKTTNVVVAHNIGAPVSGAAFRINTPVSFSGTFWDSPGRTHTAQWIFDGSTTISGTVVEANGLTAGTVRGTYSFSAPGVYKITMKVTDNTGVASWADSAGDLEAIVVIYDPSGGYTIGGGWVTAPAGSYPANPALSGKLSFGFNSKYTNATNPKGETQIHFALGNFEFNALNYDYLAISGSARAQFKGFGKVNGDAGYNFILTVIDGQATGGGGVDKFRVKIWNRNTGAIVFDNQMGASDAADPSTPVGSGSSIIIQK